MASKSEWKDKGLLDWLYAQGEERLAQLAEELVKSKSLTDGVARAIRRAAEAKGRLDQNMQSVLGLLNVPSRADYQKLLTKIETLQGSLVNVNMKLDRLLAAVQKLSEPPKRPSRPHPEPAVHAVGDVVE